MASVAITAAIKMSLRSAPLFLRNRTATLLINVMVTSSVNELEAYKSNLLSYQIYRLVEITILLHQIEMATMKAVGEHFHPAHRTSHHLTPPQTSKAAKARRKRFSSTMRRPSPQRPRARPLSRSRHSASTAWISSSAAASTLCLPRRPRP